MLLIEEGLPIDKEFYLGIVLDRASGRQVFMASSAGGMDIEEVAANTPEKIMKETIDPAVGFQPFQARKLAFGLGLPGAARGPGSEVHAVALFAHTSRWTRRSPRSILFY